MPVLPSRQVRQRSNNMCGAPCYVRGCLAAQLTDKDPARCVAALCKNQARLSTDQSAIAIQLRPRPSAADTWPASHPPP